MAAIGASVQRLEDGPLVVGAGRFAADISFPDQLHMRVVRSPLAHGRILAIAAEEARALAGVAAVWTSADIAGVPPIDFRQVRVPGLGPYRQPILAGAKVRYVGEPVAVVFAEDAYLAEDAADLVFADIEDLPPCLDPTAAPSAFDEGLSSEPAVIRKGYGDVDAAFARGRHRGRPHAYGRPAQRRAARDPRRDRPGTSAIRRPRDSWRGESPAHQPEAARRDARPAAREAAPLRGACRRRFRHSRRALSGGCAGRPCARSASAARSSGSRIGASISIAANHSRDQVHRIRAAVDAGGFILAIDDEFFADQGAYVRTHAATVPDLTAAMLPGPYVVPAYRVAGHIRLTNKTPCGTYRAPGRYEGTFVRERLIDEIARRLGKDPVEVRRVNLIPRSAMPFERQLDALGTAVTLDSGDYAGLLDKSLNLVDYGGLLDQIAARRGQGELVGFGMGYFVEKSGLGPFDGVRISLEADGRIEVVTGAASVGQGVETVIAQICADAMSAPLDAIRVVHGQTDRIRDGMGAFASRVTVMTGSATWMAAQELRATILAAGARLLQKRPEALAIDGGVVFETAAPKGASVTFADLAAAAVEDAPLAAEAWFNVSHMCYPYGIHAALVRIDRETGAVTVERVYHRL